MLKNNEIQDQREAADGQCRTIATRSPALPQARLFRRGPGALREDELLALVLGPGGPVPASVLALELLLENGSLAALRGLDPLVLRAQRGMGPARTGRLCAALELARRLLRATPRQGLLVRSPADLEPLLRAELEGRDQERFLGLYLDARHRVVALRTVSIGTLNASLVHPREVFRPAVALATAAVIVAHNHPSGCALPSHDDLELTARLSECGDLIGIELLDHLIVGDADIISIREFGWPRLPG
jgi:DNA repair protein RadC